ncbi:G-D-S-L family lipolytic protein [Tenacibaculum sp. TC6]|uniref:G-D-S-L family lipolytic protein n=1 Tax=Tenacibaculum sp. TC6 TaxID=3423223 RepID=UPI003D35C512
MKKNIIWMFGLAVTLTACDVNNDLKEISGESVPEVKLEAGTADFSKYISVGASFTAGFTDGALFIKGQENSFPNILAGKFAMANGGTFSQPLMADNIGGLISSAGVAQEPRLYFNGSGPVRLSATPTTQVGAPATGAPGFNNYGIPGAKSFHFVAPGYGAVSGLLTNPMTANPYFVRMAPSQSTVIAEVASKQPTFFTLSEIGGNDVLGYAIAGGIGVDQKDNLNPATYGAYDITSPMVFAQVFNGMVNTLTAGGAKGVVATVPYVTSLPYFTTVPHNPLDPRTNSDLAAQLPTLNTVFGALNAIYTNPAINQPNRVVEFKTDQANPVVIKDESLVDLAPKIEAALNANPQFPAFVQQFGLPAQAAPLVANLLATTYGQTRPATANDLLVLTSSSIIGKPNAANVEALMMKGLPQALAGQFSVEGLTLPLEDKWVLTADETSKVKTATDAYNATITSVATAKGLALVDFKAILQEASSGVIFDEFSMNTSLVFGGLVSLDGVHLTGRGYALMANKILEAIDATYGSNFVKATNGLARAKDYPTNYSPDL